MANLKDLWKVGSGIPHSSYIPEGGLAIDTTNKNVYSKGADGEIFEVTGLGEHVHDIEDVTGLQTELDAKEEYLGLPSVDGYVLASTTSGARSWVLMDSGAGSVMKTALKSADFIATTDQVEFVFEYDVGNLNVYVGGVMLKADEYTADSGTKFTLNIPLNAGTWVYAITKDLGAKVEWVDVINTPTTLVGYGITDSENALGNPPTDDYVLSSKADGTRSWVEMSGSAPISEVTSISTGDFTSTAGQDTFNFTYTIGELKLYVGGVLLRDDEFVATDGATFILNNPLSLNTWVHAISENPGEDVLWSSIVSTPTTLAGYGITDGENSLGNPTVDGYMLTSLADGTRSWTEFVGGGDMLKSTYDTTDNGIVDNAEKVNSLTVETAVPAGAIFTDTHLGGLLYDETIPYPNIGTLVYEPTIDATFRNHTTVSTPEAFDITKWTRLVTNDESASLNNILVKGNIQYEQANVPEAKGMFLRIGDNGMTELYRDSSGGTEYVQESTVNVDTDIPQAGIVLTTITTDVDISITDTTFGFSGLFENTSGSNKELTVQFQVDGTDVGTPKVYDLWSGAGADNQQILITAALGSDYTTGAVLGVKLFAESDNRIILRGATQLGILRITKNIPPAAYSLTEEEVAQLRQVLATQ